MSDKKPRAPKKVPIDYKNGKIYKVVNDVNDMEYIGSTTQPLPKRWYGHKADAKKHPTPFYTAVNAIGIDHFRIILVENFPCGSKAELEAREYAVMKGCDAAKIYNARIDGKHSEESKAKMAKAVGMQHDNHSFKRGSVCEYKSAKQSGWIFSFWDNGTKRSKNFSYGATRTRQEAYLLALGHQELIFPLRTVDYLQELPFADQ